MSIIDKWENMPVMLRVLTAIPVAGLALFAGYIIGAMMLVFFGYIAWRFYD